MWKRNPKRDDVTPVILPPDLEAVVNPIVPLAYYRCVVAVPTMGLANGQVINNIEYGDEAIDILLATNSVEPCEDPCEAH